MFKSIIIVVVEVIILAQSKEYSARIFEGNLATKGEFPFVVYLKLREIFNPRIFSTCTGSIIGTEWVLTAQHCLGFTRPEFITVTAGVTTYNIKSKRGLIPVKNFYLHPSYPKKYDSRLAKPGDIGLVQVSTPFVYSRVIQPVTLTSVLYPTTKYFTVGFGVIDMKINPVSLKYTEMVQYQGYKYCISDRFRLCTKTIKGPGWSGICEGDSGGPLLDSTTNLLVGVASGSWMGCVNSTAPAAYMKIGAYIGWIRGFVPDLDYEEE